MHPQDIPLLFLGLFCLLPIGIGTGTFIAWVQFTNKNPHKEIINFVDDLGRKHNITEWVMITREEKNIFKKEKEINKEEETEKDE